MPSISSVCWARLMRGSRNIGTPLAMASTPVRAEQPEENALRISRTPSASVVLTGWAAPTTAAGCERRIPMTTMPSMLTMNSTVGNISTRALSATPQRFTAVSRASSTRQTASRCEERIGKAEARLAAPAARLTATVRT